MLSTLENLIKLARERKSAPIEGSYTNKLLADKAKFVKLASTAKKVALR